MPRCAHCHLDSDEPCMPEDPSVFMRAVADLKDIEEELDAIELLQSAGVPREVFVPHLLSIQDDLDIIGEECDGIGRAHDTVTAEPTINEETAAETTADSLDDDDVDEIRVYVFVDDVGGETIVKAPAPDSLIITEDGGYAIRGSDGGVAVVPPEYVLVRITSHFV